MKSAESDELAKAWASSSRNLLNPITFNLKIDSKGRTGKEGKGKPKHVTS